MCEKKLADMIGKNVTNKGFYKLNYRNRKQNTEVEEKQTRIEKLLGTVATGE